MIEIIIIEDDAAYREGLRDILNQAPGLRCQYAFPDCESALKNLDDILPDVVLLDIELGKGMSGIEGAARIRQVMPEIDILMLTIHDEDDHVFSALRAGASGYLLKSARPEELVTAIQEVQQGGAPMSMKIARMVVHSFNDQPTLPALSERQKEVLDRLCEGKSYQTIAQELFITKSTVKFHIKNIYDILHVHSKTEAMRRVMGR